MVVMGELCIYLHLFNNLRTADDYVLISINNHRTQVEIYKAETSTEHTNQHEKKVRPSYLVLSRTFVSNFIYQVSLFCVTHFLSLND